MKTIPFKPATHFPKRLAQSSGIKTMFALVVLLGSASQSLAVVGQSLQIQGINLVLSWPSLGYEHYMIE